MGRRSMLCSGSLVLLFAGCVFVSMAAAQHGNSASPGTWTNATLSVARFLLAAASLPNEGLAIFAGGVGASYVLMSVIGGVVCGEGGGVWAGRRVLLLLPLPLLLIAVDALRSCNWR